MPKTRYAYDLPVHKVDYGVEVKVDDLRIDPEAQRTLNEGRAQSIANQLVREAMGSIVVSRRPNGDLYIVDGQHRVRVCRLLSIPTIRAEIHHDLTQAQEAVLFLIKNRESHKPRPLDEYRVGLTGNVPLFVDTDKVLKKHDLSIGSSSTNAVGAIQGVLRITDYYGAEILDRTLSIAEAAWGRSADTWDGMLIGGIGTALGKWGDIIVDAQLAPRLLDFGTAQAWRAEILSKTSRGGFKNSGTGSRLSTAYRLVVDAWNKNRRKRIEY
ncbi:DUF6551 family protein [Nonomuraea sp. NPDC050547]|uniref:DUF6551 family protein n=1 Tax=Nonomuraea sp. NPDC050547 TaxID=3364368 RepID=UPI0037A5CEA4